MATWIASNAWARARPVGIPSAANPHRPSDFDASRELARVRSAKSAVCCLPVAKFQCPPSSAAGRARVPLRISVGAVRDTLVRAGARDRCDVAARTAGVSPTTRPLIHDVPTYSPVSGPEFEPEPQTQSHAPNRPAPFHAECRRPALAQAVCERSVLWFQTNSAVAHPPYDSMLDLRFIPQEDTRVSPAARYRVSWRAIDAPRFDSSASCPGSRSTTAQPPLDAAGSLHVRYHPESTSSVPLFSPDLGRPASPPHRTPLGLSNPRPLPRGLSTEAPSVQSPGTHPPPWARRPFFRRAAAGLKIRVLSSCRYACPATATSSLQ
jgi:hypothetical protein